MKPRLATDRRLAETVLPAAGVAGDNQVVNVADAEVDRKRLEDEILAIGHDLVERLPSPASHPLRVIDDRAITASTRDRELRAALFRLVDVTPACASVEQLAEHLAGYAAELEEPPRSLRTAMRAAHTRPGRLALGAAVAGGVRHMAHRFIVGASPTEALAELRRLWDAGIGSSLDLLGEATVTSAEADRYAARCEEALATLADAYSEFPRRPSLERDAAGPLPRANLSVKVSALTPLLRPEAPQRGIDDAMSRLRPLLRSAHRLAAHLHVDMESLDTRESTLELLLEVLSEEEFRDGPSVGIVVQAYLRDSRAELEGILERAEHGGRAAPLTVRLVKGAYWDHEVVEARQHGWTPPVFERKADSDRNFEALTRLLCEHARRSPESVRVAIGSHNLRSIAHALAYCRLAGNSDSNVEIQVLRGLGDDLAHAISDAGQRARVYAPVGDLVAGMAYLVRRLLENTANESFLSEQAAGAPLEELLAAP